MSDRQGSFDLTIQMVPFANSINKKYDENPTRVYQTPRIQCANKVMPPPRHPACQTNISAVIYSRLPGISPAPRQSSDVMVDCDGQGTVALGFIHLVSGRIVASAGRDRVQRLQRRVDMSHAHLLVGMHREAGDLVALAAWLSCRKLVWGDYITGAKTIATEKKRRLPRLSL